MSHADDVFYRQFGAILASLVIFAFVAYFLANSVGGDALARIKQNPGSLVERISPVGSVVTAAKEAVAAPAQPVAAAEPAAAAAPAEPAAPAAQTAAAPQPAAVAAPTAGEPSAEVLALGEETYAGACFVCHKDGLANAPKFRDAAAWKKRAEQGLETLINSSLNGKGQLMPPKGGNPTLSDEAVRAAVYYMLKEAGAKAG